MNKRVLLAALVCAAPAYAAPLSQNEAMAAYQAAGIKAAGIDKAVDDCGAPAKPALDRVALGGVVGEAVKIEIASRTCYDRLGKHIWLLKQEGRSFKLIFDQRALAVSTLPTAHNSVADIKLTMPDYDQPIWIWNGAKYIFSKNVPK
ncbi:MAG TPA: hypothetical protein VG735_04150 [Caulobacterales bacterium]|nr:hypothetical protein [Caulobacterales bacterium]